MCLLTDVSKNYFTLYPDKLKQTFLLLIFVFLLLSIIQCHYKTGFLMFHLYNKDDYEDEALGQYIGKEGESITYIRTYIHINTSSVG